MADIAAVRESTHFTGAGDKPLGGRRSKGFIVLSKEREREREREREERERERERKGETLRDG